MARKHKHEEHTNHEAWAIPYGDLVTLLLALFVVMYAVSSVNEGKFRVMAEAMAEAFGGAPRSISPIQVGEKISKGSDHEQKMSVLPTPALPQALGGVMRNLRNPNVIDGRIQSSIAQHDQNISGSTGYSKAKADLKLMAAEVQKSLGGLIDKGMIKIHANPLSLEIEIKTDILFASGQAGLSDTAAAPLMKLAEILGRFPNAMRIEGHTDNMPINTVAFPSNWELSAARAASVVHLFMEQGVDPKRMSVEGWGEYQPVGDNATAEGRNRNRRVVLVVLATDNVREFERSLDNPPDSAAATSADPAPAATVVAPAATAATAATPEHRAP
ncbi:MAG: flagellar motor protein MotD [Nevskiaceae bacterium]|nr:MAG: flagellar motor protein MotD [Nevskiaceae bacterium]